ncbi:MAG TPA: hypothetical protein VH370_00495 [Humisphaera sp.]|jgi:hypothetical protein|nr:hypothetical protein [Humisphaera sp.]
MAPEKPTPEDKGRSQPEGDLIVQPGPAFAEPEERVADLSSEIVKQLPRGSGERVTCRRITGNHYRCNWWTPQIAAQYGARSAEGMTATTHRVSKSQFLHVTKTAGTLAIKAADAS